MGRFGIDPNILQGSGATPLRCVGILNDRSIANFLGSVTVDFENRSIFGEFMTKKTGCVVFLPHSVYMCTCVVGFNVDLSAVVILHRPTADVIHDSSRTCSRTFLH